MNKKAGLHPKNKHKSGYDFPKMIKSYPALLPFVVKKPDNTETINFSDPKAVVALNAALLKTYYNVDHWQIPLGYLCPPIPGRADYIHHIAELIKSDSKLSMLDIGVGANCIYPLIAHSEYDWTAVGSDIDEVALNNAQSIIDKNKLNAAISLRLQKNPAKIFDGIIHPEDYFHFTICNPPFHASAEDAAHASNRKNQNLGHKKNNLNFGGKNSELWCEGGEIEFITKMIHESVNYKKNVHWFTSLVSRYESLPFLLDELNKLGIKTVRTLDMAQGQKKSRILAWSFF
jgi:23S rRNA (adenine1618-N6)-methyltransferase